MKKNIWILVVYSLFVLSTAVASTDCGVGPRLGKLAGQMVYPYVWEGQTCVEVGPDGQKKVVSDYECAVTYLDAVCHCHPKDPNPPLEGHWVNGGSNTCMAGLSCMGIKTCEPFQGQPSYPLSDSVPQPPISTYVKNNHEWEPVPATGGGQAYKNIANSEFEQEGKFCIETTSLKTSSAYTAKAAVLDIDVIPVQFEKVTLATTELAPMLIDKQAPPNSSSALISTGILDGYDVSFQLKTAEDIEHTHRVFGNARVLYKKLGPDIFGSINSPSYPLLAGIYESSANLVKPIRYAAVVLQDDCGHYLKTFTDNQGDFEFEWSPIGCSNTVLTVWAVSKGSANKAAVGRWKNGTADNGSVLTNKSSDYEAYSFFVNINEANAKKSNGGLHKDIIVSPSASVAIAKAFFILLNALAAMEYFDGITGVDPLPKLNILYSPGIMPADFSEWSKADRSNWYFRWNRYDSKIGTGFINIASEPVDFGWADNAHIHEVAHVFYDYYVRSEPFNSVPYNRFGEPMANVHAGAILSTPWMYRIANFENMDVNANYYNDLETFGILEESFQFVDGIDSPGYSEGWVWRLFWDLIDDGQANEPITEYLLQSKQPVDVGQFDFFNGSLGWTPNSQAVNDVIVNYLGGGKWGKKNSAYVDRGATGVDLVDMLDGLMCRGHANTIQIDKIINHAMGFGYDYAGPESCD